MHVKKRLQIIFILVMIYSLPLFAGEYYYHLHDHLGSVRVVVDKDANVIESYDYYPFGAERRSMINANQSAHLRFTGKELDNDLDLGLYYFGARYYDPEVGRFLSVDPLADKYPGWSPYVYCFNNPLNYVDPNGMEVVGDSTQLAQIANSVNEENNTSDAVAVERVDVAAKTITVFGKTITLKKASTYFRLNVNGESSFNWRQGYLSHDTSCQTAPALPLYRRHGHAQSL